MNMYPLRQVSLTHGFGQRLQNFMLNFLFTTMYDSFCCIVKVIG